MKRSRTLSLSESLTALDQCRNKSAANREHMLLPDGDRNAERVHESYNKRTGCVEYSLCAPWLLCGVFSARHLRITPIGSNHAADEKTQK